MPFSSDRFSQADAAGKNAGGQCLQAPQDLEERLPTILLDVDAIEGKLSRRDERDSNYTDHTTMQNVLISHGGLVAGDNKGLTCFFSLQGL